MMKTNLGLLVSLTLLIYMAVFSEKLVLVTTGYAVPREELVLGGEIYAENCRRCHARGRSGAPRTGDHKAWKKRISKGLDTLAAHAREGYRGKEGHMPPKGGNPRLKDDEIEAAVAYMVWEAEAD